MYYPSFDPMSVSRSRKWKWTIQKYCYIVITSMWQKSGDTWWTVWFKKKFQELQLNKYGNLATTLYWEYNKCFDSSQKIATFLNLDIVQGFQDFLVYIFALTPWQILIPSTPLLTNNSWHLASFFSSFQINHDLFSSLFDRKVPQRQTTVKNTQTETHPLSNILNPTIQQIVSKRKEQNPQTYIST